MLTPSTIGKIAAAGIGKVRVHRRPKVAIVETGDELVEPGGHLRPGSVFAANGITLAAAVTDLGGVATRFTAPDDRSLLKETLSRAMAGNDLVITSGGASVGDYDLVRPVLHELGVGEKFWRAAIRPGKPVFFGTATGGPAVLGLPGNPGSAVVTFLLFARPFLQGFQGVSPDKWIKIETDTQVEPSPGVETFMRVLIQDRFAKPVAKQGSNMISSVAGADALLRIPTGDRPLARGTELPALRIRWGL